MNSNVTYVGIVRHYMTLIIDDSRLTPEQKSIVYEYHKRLDELGGNAISCLARAVTYWSRIATQKGAATNKTVGAYLEQIEQPDYVTLPQRQIYTQPSLQPDPTSVDRLARQLATQVADYSPEEGTQMLSIITTRWVIEHNDIRDATAIRSIMNEFPNDTWDAAYSRLLRKWLYREIEDIVALEIIRERKS